MANYDRVAWFYEQSSRLYSTNQIRRSKASQLVHIRAGDRVLYLGVGAGEDAVMAARKGARVTCIDCSPKMLDRVARRFAREDLPVELICGDARQHDRFAAYDVVAANYFLNCFREPQMREFLQLAASFCRPRGLLMIADVSLPQGNWLARCFNVLYLKAAMGAFWMMGLVPWHRNYDYPANFADAGIQLRQVEYFRFLKRGPVLFQNIVAVRQV